ncbi:phosphoglyceromutase [Sediminibacterium soli]|uniref:phosphoglyceromutase n=1 Tax=Sediminibacterium soli TaxID=2698829 RepID=UPI00137A4AA4|nr:phosphoglyceromutase [Sediminibacterium soli]NCI45384.1 phosphoglyceromutase [Sediminibacterium soli]
MKQPLTVLLLSFCLVSALCAQEKPKNIFIITIDGFRWQELFNGADPELVNNTAFVNDTALLKELYDDSTAELRRQKLLPFFWSVIARKGQLTGNRAYGNRVNVSNFYKISYPGYNELLTGYADPRPVLNTPTPNRNTNILEYLNKEEEYTGKVVAFSSWNIFPYIINEKRNGIPVNSGYEAIEESDSTDRYINQVQGNIDESHCRYDRLTYLAAKEYIQKHHPKVAMIGFGETDEYAHQRKYDMYLQHANAIDRMIAELWYMIQTDPFYRNNTYLYITTDHGRGKKPTSWYAHNLFVKGSGETWQAILGPGIAALGEIKIQQQAYQKQIAGTIAALLGKSFRGSDNPVIPVTAIQTNAHETVTAESAKIIRSFAGR